MRMSTQPRTPVATRARRAGKRTRWEMAVGVYFVLFPLLAGAFLSVEAARAMEMDQSVPARQTVMAVAP